MWIPLLEREVEHAALVSWRVARDSASVLCILDPPRYALGEEKYRAAQEETALLYKELQRSRDTPLPVALQDEFWQALQRPRRRWLRSRKEEKDGPEPSGGFGIVNALRAHAPHPPVVRLEEGVEAAAFPALKARAVEVMERASPLLGWLAEAYERTARAVCSPPLREAMELASVQREPRKAVRDYLPPLMQLARVLGVPQPHAAVVYARALQIEGEHDARTIEWEERKLRGEIQARGTASSLPPRAALELYRWQLASHHGGDPEYLPALEFLAELLTIPAADTVVDDGIIRVVAREMDDPFGEYLGQGIRIRAQDQRRPHRGHAELTSRLLELGVVLGVDVLKYPALRHHVYRSNLWHALQEVSDYMVGRDFTSLVEALQEDVMRAAATTDADAEVLDLLPQVEMMHELRALRVGHGERAQDALRRFGAEAFWRRLRALDPALPAAWRDEARQVDDEFDAVLEFNQASLLRGKNLAHTLLRQMRERELQAAILVCDGYLQGAVQDGFAIEKDATVSYAFLVPA